MSTGTPLTSFTLFPTLPFELRLKIWGLITPGPRIVTIGYGSQSTKHKGKSISVFNGWRSSDPIPDILHICHESREEALKSYKPAFGSHFHASKVYFDFSKDILRFGKGSSSDYLHRVPEWLHAGPCPYQLDLFLAGGYYGGDDSEKVHHMIIDLDEGLYGRKYLLWAEIKDFTALKELTILPWEVAEDENMITDLMAMYRSTMQHDLIQSPEWKAPRVIVNSAFAGTEWGTLTVENTEVKMERAITA